MFCMWKQIDTMSASKVTRAIALSFRWSRPKDHFVPFALSRQFLRFAHFWVISILTCTFPQFRNCHWRSCWRCSCFWWNRRRTRRYTNGHLQVSDCVLPEGYIITYVGTIHFPRRTELRLFLYTNIQFEQQIFLATSSCCSS